MRFNGRHENFQVCDPVTWNPRASIDPNLKKECGNGQFMVVSARRRPTVRPDDHHQMVAIAREDGVEIKRGSELRFFPGDLFTKNF